MSETPSLNSAESTPLMAPGWTQRREPTVLLALWVLCALASAYHPLTSTAVWLMEAGPAIAGALILIATRERFPFTRLVYVAIFVHACVLTLGAHYSYAQVPLGEWIRDAFDLQRNHYDRLGHFVQGFVPALITREILLRLSPLERGKLLVFLVTCVCFAIGAFYELLEWWVAVALPGSEAGDDFLGTQGDVWDAQWDMFLCLLGAISALASLSWLHDRQLRAAGH